MLLPTGPGVAAPSPKDFRGLYIYYNDNDDNNDNDSNNYIYIYIYIYIYREREREIDRLMIIISPEDFRGLYSSPNPPTNIVPTKLESTFPGNSLGNP